MKQALLVGALIIGLSNVAAAQGVEVHTCYGPSGTHIPVPADTQTFNYEATVSGGFAAYTVFLDVFHNGVLKSTTLQVVLFPPPNYLFNVAVNMSSWGLTAGDHVTFRCRVVGLAFGKLLASHTLIGDVVPPGAPLP